MLVYPEQSEVELYYGYTLSDNVGHILTALGLLALGIAATRRRHAPDRPS